MLRYTKHKNSLANLQNKKSFTTPHPKHTQNMRTRMRQRRKMLASTIQFSHNTPTPQQPHTTNSASIIHVQANKTTTTTHNTTCVQAMCCPRHPTACQHTQNHVCETLGHTPAPHKAEASNPAGAHPPGISKNTVAVTPTATSTTNPQPWAQNKKLLRKEVIQPHLPVRLPCYDFVPIADPTFDHSLTRLGHGLRVLPTFMT